MEAKLGETELKLTKAASLNTVRAEELVDLKAALEVVKANGMTRVLSTHKTQWSPSSTKLGSWLSRRAGWQPYKPLRSPRIPL